MMNEINLSKAVGIMFYSPKFTKSMEVGKNYFHSEDTAKHICEGAICRFRTEYSGSFCISVNISKPPDFNCIEPKPEFNELKLCVQVFNNTLIFRNEWDLYRWQSEQYNQEQKIEIENGFYEVYVYSWIPESGIIGDNQKIELYFNKVSQLPELGYDRVPYLRITDEWYQSKGAFLYNLPIVQKRKNLRIFNYFMPTYYPYENTLDLISLLHEAIEEEKIKVGYVHINHITDKELIEIHKKVFSDASFQKIKGDIRTHDDKILGSNISPLEAFELLNQWGISNSQKFKILDTAIKITNQIQKETWRKYLRLEFVEEIPPITASRLGGVPYLPHNAMPPMNKNSNNQLRFLAQIDCTKLTELEDFPHSGLLQFWISEEYLMADNICKVIYYNNVDETVTREEVSVKITPLSEGFFHPIDGELGLEFFVDWEGMTEYDYRFNSLFAEKYNEIFPENPTNDIYHLDIDFNITNGLKFGHKIDGYAQFFQEDGRYYENQNHEILLLQLSSESFNLPSDRVMWGDGGVGNFTITKEALKNLDFGDVFFQWDCT